MLFILSKLTKISPFIFLNPYIYRMLKTPPALSKGDTIAIVAPAKAIEEKHVLFAKNFLEENGFIVVVGRHCLRSHHYFSGTQEERLGDLQWAIDAPEVKAHSRVKSDRSSWPNRWHFTEQDCFNRLSG